MRVLGAGLAMCLLAAFCIWSCLILMVAPVTGWMKMSEWESTPATLEHAEIIRFGHQPVRERLVVGYSFQFEGFNYQGQGITVYPASQSMPKTLQRELLAQFKEQAEQQTLRVFVNPELPTESSLTKDFFPYWYLSNIYMLVLSLYFAFGVFCLLKLGMSSSDDTAKENANNNAAEGQTESGVWKFIGYFAGLFMLFSVAIVMIIVNSLRVNDYGALAFAIFPIAALFLCWLTHYLWVRRFDAPEASTSGASV